MFGSEMCSLFQQSDHCSPVLPLCDFFFFPLHMPLKMCNTISLPLSPLPTPVPCPNLYAQLNALQLVLDPRSLVWINLFALDLRQSLEQFMEIYKLNDLQKPDEHVDIKVDGLMLKVRKNAETFFQV